MTNPHLELSDPAANTKRLELPQGTAEVVVGRASDCQLVIASAAVSRRHARIRRENDRFILEDLGSSNGTLLNGERLSAPAVLKDQDRISFGSVEALFVAPAPETEATLTISPPPMAEIYAEPSPPPAPHPTPVPKAPPAHEPPPPPPTAQPAQDVATEPLPAPPSPVAGPIAVTAPSIVELAAIAFGSFVVVFTVGWVVLRYVVG